MTMRRVLAVLAILALVAGAYVYAATNLTTSLAVRLNPVYSNTLDFGTAQMQPNHNYTLALTNGTGAASADMIWNDTRSLGTGATEDLDLNGGGLTDVFGVAFEPVRVKLIMVTADSSNTTNLTVFGDALSLPALDDPTDTFTVKPAGVMLLVEPGATGWAVGAGATDIVQVANSAGATASYSITIIGASS